MTSRTTQQSLLDYESIAQNFPGITERGINDYYAKGIDLARVLAQMGPTFGSGNPNGVTTSGLSRLYVDSDTNTMYANPNFGVKTGWVAV